MPVWVEIVMTQHIFRASLVAQSVKNPPAMQETWVRSLGWEEPLEKGLATHSLLGDFYAPGVVFERL